MSQEQKPEKLAAQQAAEAVRHYEAGALAEAIATMRRAVLLYAAVQEETPLFLDARAGVCQRCGDYLTEAEQLPEAAALYQEAADLYARLDGPEASEQAHRCAQKILANVATLHARPQERLYLLIAHYERQRQQLTLQPGTERQQAEVSMQIARIFQRRDRPQEAIARYQEALQLFARAPHTPAIGLDRAECHHRIATLYHHALAAAPAAARHYREAIALYAAFEPPAYGEQASRALCERALAELDKRARRQGATPETYPE